jgi:AraC family transcriptional regulator of adaptative response/methylated-DNA-[protein]-cysteine methyltransferase
MLQLVEKPATMPAAPSARQAGPVDAVERACRYIDGRIDGDADSGVVTLKELGGHCGLSPWHLQRLFKRVMGVSPRQYADARRLQRFKSGLLQGDGVAAATYGAGYGSSSRVYERADAALGMTPATYARGGRGAHIAYAVAGSPLGRLLVAATARGVCFVSLGRHNEELESNLRAEFPAAEEIRRDDAALAPAVAAILDHLRGAEPHVALPLDIRATAFQRRVWEELRRIPRGETRSYGEVARALGRPQAQRAVAQACARNPVAIVVPCHRVVRGDGVAGGYRWGSERKRRLLRQEAKLR